MVKLLAPYSSVHSGNKVQFYSQPLTSVTSLFAVYYVFSMTTKAPQRLRALALYKDLHRLGREYEPSYNFHGKLRMLYEKNRNLTDEGEIERALQFGEYIKNETLALYALRKYRHLKRMYPSTSDPS